MRSDINVVLQNIFVIQTDTVRENLDPRKLSSDSEIEIALANSAFSLNRKGRRSESEVSLDRTSQINGNEQSAFKPDLNKVANDFSIGQQQLLNLAYALL